jgi:two-component system, NtrC family, sensor kinase
MELTKRFESLKTLSSSTKGACEKIIGIVTNLRKFARLDEKEFNEVDIHLGIDSTLELLQYLREDRIELIKDYGKVPIISCYAAQINQVFMNILVNAYQSIEGSGKIFIKTDYQDEIIHLVFKDTGSGIPKENVEKIFDPGFTTKGVGVGTGLGLSIAYQIIEDHGGSIQVESVVGKGTNISIQLPTKR